MEKNGLWKKVLQAFLAFTLIMSAAGMETYAEEDGTDPEIIETEESSEAGNTDPALSSSDGNVILEEEQNVLPEEIVEDSDDSEPEEEIIEEEEDFSESNDASANETIPESSDLSQFVKDVEINGAQETPEGTLVVKKGQTYNVDLTFEETNDLQFSMDETLTYQLPDGFNPLDDEGTLDIAISYRDTDGNRVTETVKGNSYTINEDGSITLDWNHDDPNYEKLEDATDVTVNLHLSGTFDENAKELDFGNKVTKTIYVDPNAKVAVEKTGSYSKANGKIYYGLGVYSSGVNENVVVTDTLGTALKLDSGSFTIESSIHGALSLEPTVDGNTFTYTIPKMTDGETITIIYAADVDYDKITPQDGTDGGTKEETLNTVKASSNQDSGGDSADKDFEHQIDYTSINKSAGEASGDSSTKTVPWTITYNQEQLKSAAGAKITDQISDSSWDIMKYSGDGITVNVYGEDGSLVETREVSWEKLGVDPETDRKFTYEIPDTDTEKYRYEISYTTDVDVTGKHEDVTVANTGSDDHGHTDTEGKTIGTESEEDLSVYKKVVSTSWEEIKWEIDFTVPKSGAGSAVITDKLPSANSYTDSLQEDTLVIQDSQGNVLARDATSGEGYTLTNENGKFTVSFYYYDESDVKHNGFAASDSRRNFTMTFTTTNNAEWMAEYESGSVTKRHTNHVEYTADNTTERGEASTIPVDGINLTKSVESGGDPYSYVTIDGRTYPVWKFTTTVSGLTNPGTIVDTFDTLRFRLMTLEEIEEYFGADTKRVSMVLNAGFDLEDLVKNLEVEAPFIGAIKVGDYLGEDTLTSIAESLEAPLAAAYSSASIVNYVRTESTSDGVNFNITQDNLDRWDQVKKILQKSDILNKALETMVNTMFPSMASFILSSITIPELPIDYYYIDYYLIPKNVEALNTISNESVTYKNTASISDVSDDADFRYEYNPVSKELKNYEEVEGETYGKLTGSNSYRAHYKLTINEAGAVIGDGKTATVTDTFTNQSIIYTTVALTYDGETVTEPEEGVSWDMSGNSIVFTIPDRKPVTIEYDSIIIPETDAKGNPVVTEVTNSAETGGKSSEVDKWIQVESYGDGTASFGSINVYKYSSGNMADKIDGAVFTLYANMSDAQNNINALGEYTVKDGVVQIDSVTNTGKNKGKSTLIWNTRYYLKETQAPEGYAASGTIYSFMIVKDPKDADYSNYIYYDGDYIRVKNTPETSVSAEKVWKDYTGNVMTSAPEGASVTFELYADDIPTGKKVTMDGEVDSTIGNDGSVYGETSEWKAVWKNLPKKDDEGKDISYKVVETKAYTGYEKDSVETIENEDGTTSVEISNKKSVGSLKIRKNVTVNGSDGTTTLADGTYTFGIYTDSAGTSIAKDASGKELNNITVTVKNGKTNSKTVKNLYAGTYYVKELSSTNAKVTLVKGLQKIEVEAGTYAEVKTVSFTNNRDTGSLQVTKNVRVNENPVTDADKNLADGTYTFKVYSDKDCTKEAVDAYGTAVGKITVTVTGGKSSTSEVVKNLDPGTYYVKETGSTNANMTLVTDPVSVEVKGGKTAETATASFTNNRNYGSITITKNVTVDSAATTGTLADGTYYFNVTDANGNTVKDVDGNTVQQVSITITDGKANTAKVDKLFAGTYKITEDTSKSTNNNVSLVGNNGIEVTVGTTANASGTAEFTNNRNYGKLTITKNVTVDSASTTGTLADGTYYFNVTDKDGKAVTNVDGKTVNQVSITVKNGSAGTAEVDRLAPGTYKVTEDISKSTNKNVSLVGTNGTIVTIPDNADATSSASFTNNRSTGGLQITKNVTVDGTVTNTTLADGTYTFRIKDSSGNYAKDKDGKDVSTVTITISNGTSNSATVKNLLPGEYTVSEDTSKSTNKNVTLTTGNDIKVTVTASTTQAVTASFTNNYSTGSLQVKKNVTVNGSVTTTTLADGEYTFTVYTDEGCKTIAKDKNGADVTLTVTVSGGKAASATKDGILPGTYYVKETAGTNANVTLSTKVQSVTVTGNNTSSVPTVEFTNNRNTGSLTITKNVTVNGQNTTTTLADGTYTFKVYSDAPCKNIAKDAAGAEVSDVTITITNGKTSVASVTNLNPGTYYVKETSSTNKNMTLVKEAFTVEVTGGKDAKVKTAEFTNNRNIGSLKITKNVTVNGESTTSTLADGTYSFSVTDAEGKAVTDANGKTVEKVSITIVNGSSGTVEVKNLIPGTYKITEIKADSTNKQVSIVGDESVTVTVEDKSTASVNTASFTNNRDTGSFKITKNVTLNGKTTTGTLADGTYTFKVYSDETCTTIAKDASGTAVSDLSITIKNGASSDGVVTNLNPGTYYVKEASSDNTYVTLDTKEYAVTVAGGKNAVVNPVTFTNNRNTGSLKITKNVTVNGKSTTGKLADGTYYFNVTDTNGKAVTDADGKTVETVSITIVNGSAGTAEVKNLNPGTYKVKEDTSKSTNKNVSLVGDNGKTVTIPNKADATSEVSYTNNRNYGSITIEKKVTVDSEETREKLADGTYYFNVTDADGNAVKDVDGKSVGQISIKITNGASSSATVEKLAPGTYKITEDTSQITDTRISLVGDNEITVTVADSANAKADTASFTNNYATGGLVISKTVTVDGKSTTTTWADGDYTFTVYSDAACMTAAAEHVTITISEGKSNSVTVSSLAAGTYYVKETGSTNSAVSLATDEVVMVEVSDGETAAAAKASFTNNRDTGSLKISKNVTVNGSPTTTTLADGTYTFTVYSDGSCTTVAKDSNNADAVLKLTVENGKASEGTVTGLLPGKYYVKETEGSNENVTLSTDVKEVEVKAGNSSDIPTVSFTNNRNSGGFNIEKNVTVDGKETTGTLADGTYYFAVTDAEGNAAKDADGKEVSEFSIAITNGKSSSVSVGNLNPGTYKVTENTEKSSNKAMSVVSDGTVEVVVSDGRNREVPTVSFTNNRNTGSLKITKNVTVNGEATDTKLADGTYTFTVYSDEACANTAVDKDGKEAVLSLTITDGVSSDGTVTGLAPGTYYVKETESSNDYINVLPETAMVVVSTEENAEIGSVEFTNNRNTGSLEITKNVTVNGDPTDSALADGTYTFKVTDVEGKAVKDAFDEEIGDLTITITNGQSNTATVENLNPGTYKVTEVTDELPKWMRLVSDESAVLTVNDSENYMAGTAEFTNNRNYGYLTIEKKVTVNSAPTESKIADGIYTFVITDSEGNAVTDAKGNAVGSVPIEVVNGHSNTAKVENLNPGTYVVKEDISNLPAGMNLVSDGAVTLVIADKANANGDTASFTNNLSYGSLTIEKKVTVDSESTTGTLADGTYVFNITDADGKSVTDAEGKTVESVSIEIKDGQSSTTVVDKLLPGTYVISEDTENLPEGMSLITKSVTVTVEADSMEKLPTASFTNNRSTGGLTIIKHVTVGGEAVTSDAADGTYTFTLFTDEACTSAAVNSLGETAAASITVENGVSSSANVKNLPAGVYYVKETGSTNENMDITGQKVIQVTVHEDQTVEPETIEFTNDRSAGNLSITKNVTVDGESTTGTLADGTYTFKVKDSEGNEAGTVSIEVVNGSSGTAEITGLLPGKYTVSETDSDNPYVKLVTENDVEVTVKVNETNSAEFTNNYETTEASIKKVWVDNENGKNARPESLTVTLSNGTEVVLNEDNGWSYTVRDLPKYVYGKEIEYTWREETVSGYELTGNVTEGTLTTLTNKYSEEEPEEALTEISVSKVWNDSDDLEGIRPDSITATLLRNGTAVDGVSLSEENGWTHTFTELPEKDSDGNAYVYTVSEAAVEGYETSVSGDMASGFVITNTHEVERVSIPVTKKWVDDDNSAGIRPESITVTLLRNGEAVDTVTLSEENAWNTVFSDLEPYDENGNAYVYTVEETAVEGYTSHVSGDMASGFTVTNIAYEVETVSLSVVKTWRNDENDAWGIRPESITVHLYQATASLGTVEIGTGVITEAEGWSHVFGDLPKYVNGEEASYSVVEEEVEYYIPSSEVGSDGTVYLYNDLDQNNPKLPQKPKVPDDNPKLPNQPKTPEEGNPKLPGKPSVPDTRDDMNMSFWTGSLAGSLALAMALLYLLLKKEEEEI